ncbi:MAG: hypothetical protein V3T17_03380 [Pseudomonadales bacterium]
MIKNNHFDFEAELKSAHEENRKMVIAGLIIGVVMAVVVFAIV